MIVLRAVDELVAQQQLTVDVDNGSWLAGFAAIIVDEHGNNVLAADVPLHVHCDTLHIDVATGSAVPNQRGEAVFGNRLLVQCESVPSTHQLVVSARPAAGVAAGTRKRGRGGRLEQAHAATNRRGCRRRAHRRSICRRWRWRTSVCRCRRVACRRRSS
jgi:hypothetical protein